MENNLEIFRNEEFGEIRTVTINGEPWFVGKDITEALGYSNSRKTIYDHVDYDDKEVTICDTPGGQQKMTVINESGLYSLILSSKLPNARKFKRWVTAEVLPTIRKHGMYATDDLLNNPDLAIKTFEALKAERERNKQLTADNEMMKPKALFADAVATSKTSILVGDMAKILKQNGIEMGQKRFFDWLRANGYLIRRKGTDWNMPTQRSMEMKLFEIKEHTHLDSNGVNVTTKTPKITGKGQVYFVNKFLKAKESEERHE